MLRTRIILIIVCVLVIWGLFLLPKAVVENDSQLAAPDSATNKMQPSPHASADAVLLNRIKSLRARYLLGSKNEKSAIFADSLTDLYREAGRFDSAAWFAEEAATFFKSNESNLKAGNAFYEAFTFSVDRQKQKDLAEKAQTFFVRVLEIDPKNSEVKTKMAMTYVTSSAPMRGIKMLREVLADDPGNESALFNLGMLSIQSGQYDRAVDHLLKLIAVNPKHLQGQLLLGVAYMNKGDKEKARQQFEQVKKLDGDPSVQATADSYLKDLK